MFVVYIPWLSDLWLKLLTVQNAVVCVVQAVFISRRPVITLPAHIVLL